MSQLKGTDGIEGKWATIKQANTQDMNHFISLLTHPNYGHFSPFQNMNKEQASNAIKTLLQNRDHQNLELWSVWDKLNHQFAGFTGYQSIKLNDTMEKMFFVGFYPKHWQSELPLEAIKLSIESAFRDNHVAKLISFIHPEDNHSLQCAHNIKAKFESETTFAGVPVFMYSCANYLH